MWTWSLNWGEITPRILIGSCPMRPSDLDRIVKGTAVSAVLCVQHDACLAYWAIDYGQMSARGAKLGLDMRRSPMRDFDIVDQRRHLARAVKALASLQAQGHRTYVHCTAGLGRAPLTVLSYLTWVEGLDLQQAIGLIHQGRPEAVPALEAHYGCRSDLIERHHPRIQDRAYALSQGREAGQGDPHSDWLQAEAQILRAELSDT